MFRRSLSFTALSLFLAFAAQAGQNQQLAQQIQAQIETRNQLRASEMKRFEALAQLPQPQWNDFDVTYYRLELGIDFDHRRIAGTAQVGLRVLADSLRQVGLDFCTQRMRVSSVGMAATGYQARGDSLILTLDRAYTVGETLRVAVTYQGRPGAPDFPVFTWRTVNGYPAVFSDNEPYYARCWFPCRDYPGDKADSVDIIVRVPRPLTVASNGTLRRVVDNGDGTKTFFWHESYPITTYLMAIGVADFRVYEEPYVSASGDTMPVVDFLYPSDFENGKEDLNITVPAIQAYASLWGEYPFLREKYGQVQYGGPWGGMEDQTVTMLNEAIFTGQHRGDLTVVHELAHQWWGDMISPADFGHVWLNEGFATYAEGLWLEHVYGPEGLRSFMNVTMNIALNQMGPIYRQPGQRVIVSVVYDKGACVLHMLRRMLGDSVFFGSLRNYRERYAYGVATTEDLQHVFEEHSGRDLGWFFRQWIYEPGHPVVGWDWSAQETDSGFVVKGFLEQVQTVGPEVFRFPVKIRVEGSGFSISKSLWMDSRSLDFALQVPGQPTLVLLNPDQDVLMEQKRLARPLPERLSWSYHELAGDGDGRWEPGETVALTFSYRNGGRSVDSLTVRIEPVGDDLLATPAVVSLFPFNHSDTVAVATDQAVQIRASADASDRLAVIRLHLRMAGGYSAEDSVLIPLGSATVLFVDDDGGKDYDHYYTDVFQRALVFADTWSVATQGSPDVDPARYRVLIWATGDVRQGALTAEEQAKIRDFLARGGRVLIAGQNIAASLASSGAETDTVFLHDVLHARFVADDPPTKMTLGSPGDPIGDRLFVYFDGSFGTRDPISPDVVTPLAPAVGFLGYAGHRDSWAGIRWYDPGTGAALVFLSFGLEAVRGPYEDSGARLLNRCVTWLTNPTPSGVEADRLVPHHFHLAPVYPNPFNPGTTVRFDLPRRELVRLTVYNLLGQPVRTLLDQPLDAGGHRLRWDGRDGAGRELPTGIYVIELRAGEQVARQKAVRIR